MDPLEAQSRRLLDAYKTKASPASRDAEEVWSEIVARVDRDAEAPSRPPRPLWAWMAAGGTLAAGLVLWAMGSVLPERISPFAGSPEEGLSTDLRSSEDTLHAVRAHRSRAVGERSPAAAPEEHLVEREAEPQTPAEVAETAEEKASTPRRSARVRHKTPRPSAEDVQHEAPPTNPLDALNHERHLLKQARATLSSGEASRALSVVQAYHRAYPEGLLREEMALLEVRALCHLGRDSAWKRARARFLDRYPGSPLAAHLDDKDCQP